MQHKGVAVIAAVLALGLASCGGTSNGSADAQFRAQANAACQQIGAQVQAIAKAATDANRSRSLRKASSAIRQGVEQLDAITPPQSAQSQFEQLKLWIAARGDAARELAKPHPHLSGRSRKVMEGRKSPLRKIASSLGVRSCS